MIDTGIGINCVFGLFCFFSQYKKIKLTEIVYYECKEN